jgi:molybdopterin molybdotransferase
MISVSDALGRVLAGIAPLSAETVALPQGNGRVLAADLTAAVSHPPLAVSSMDGWAVRAEDVGGTSTRLSIIGESAAGHSFAGTVESGQTVRIFTGAPLPAGADAVIMQEDSRRDGDAVIVSASPTPGKFVRPRGLDFNAGDVLLRAGTVLGPRQLGLAAAMNLPWLPVRRRPVVAILSTGDEIHMPGEALGPSGIPGSNGPALAALVEAQGGIARHLGIAADTHASISALVGAAAGADLLVVSGGASVGDYDLVGDALRQAGLSLDFWKVALRPGKPLMSGRLHNIPVLGLPGNPVSAYVCAVLFLVPLMRAMQGLDTALQTVPAVLSSDLPANDSRQDHLRASLSRASDGTLIATPFTKQDSAVLSGLSAADALLVRAPLAPAALAGETVGVIPLVGL